LKTRAARGLLSAVEHGGGEKKPWATAADATLSQDDASRRGVQCVTNPLKPARGCSRDDSVPTKTPVFPQQTRLRPWESEDWSRERRFAAGRWGVRTIIELSLGAYPPSSRWRKGVGI